MVLALGPQRFALSQGGGGGAPWYYPDALDIDIVNQKWAASDIEYASEAELSTAVGNGATYLNGLIRTIGAYVVPGQTNLLVDSNFPDGSTAWPVSGSGASETISGNELNLISGGVAGSTASQLVEVEPEKAYKITGEYARGAGANGGAKFAVGNNAGLGSPITQTSLAPATNYVAANLFASPIGGETALRVGLYNAGTAGNSKMRATGLYENTLYKGFGGGGVSGIFESDAPADTTGTKIGLSGFLNTTNIGVLRTQWYIGVVSGRLRLFVSDEAPAANTRTLANLDLGAISANQHFNVQFVITTGLIAAVRDGGAPVTGALTRLIGFSHLRIHSSQDTANNLWGHERSRVTIFNTLTLPPGVNNARFAINGDSYPAAWVSKLAALMGRAPRSFTQGGSQMSLILDKWLGNADPKATAADRNLLTIVCDGDTNGYGSVSAYMDLVTQFKNATTGPLIWVGPARRSIVGAGDNADRTLIQQAEATLFGDHYVDLQAVLAAGATSPGDDSYVANNYVPISLLQSDQVHLNATGVNLICNAIWAKIQALGLQNYQIS